MTTDRTRAIVDAAERLAKAIDAEAMHGDDPPPLVVAARLDLARALALPASPPVPESKLRAVYRAAERLADGLDLSVTPSGGIYRTGHARECECDHEDDLDALLIPLGRALALPAEPAPAWTSTPPSEPGWYWSRVVIPSQSWIGPPTPREWAPGDWTIDGERLRQFWPVPIQPPEET